MQCTPSAVTLTVRVLLVGVRNQSAVVLLIQLSVIVIVVVTFIPLREKIYCSIETGDEQLLIPVPGIGTDTGVEYSTLCLYCSES